MLEKLTGVMYSQDIIIEHGGIPLMVTFHLTGGKMIAIRVLKLILKKQGDQLVECQLTYIDPDFHARLPYLHYSDVLAITYYPEDAQNNPYHVKISN